MSVTTQNTARCAHRFSRPQPKTHSPRKVDSTKNATSVSIASDAPKTLPAKCESPFHAIPSWNSITSPVTMPIT